MIRNALVLFGIAVVLLLLFIPSYSQLQDLKKKNNEYATRIEDLIKENEALRYEHKLLQEDPEYLEKVARERMGLIRQGEVVYKLVPPKEDNKQ